MKKIAAFLLALAVSATTATVFASEDSGYAWNRPGFGYPDFGYQQTEYARFYISRWGTQLDEEGNIESRDMAYFTSSIAKSKLTSKLDNKFSIAIGKNVTENDIAAYYEERPNDEDVFALLTDEYKDRGAVLYSNKGEVIDWDNFNEDNYAIQWYVLKHEFDGWHIDGRIMDKRTNDSVSVVLPEEKEEFEEKFDTAIDLKGVKYAYIFGYEPIIVEKVNEEGVVETTAEIEMGMDDPVTNEQVSSMIMRMLDQANITSDENFKMVPAVEPHAGQWYERGLLYLCSVGGFDSNEVVTVHPATRGEVAKMVACALKLGLSEETTFKDIDDSQYKEYIEKVYKYGYMEGEDAHTFAPDRVMTRAEFCSLFNNIIGRDKMGLTARGENNSKYEVTAETYYFVDMNPDHWAYEVCLKATSAYDSKGYVDTESRNANIRNIIDRYDSQKEY